MKKNINKINNIYNKTKEVLITLIGRFDNESDASPIGLTSLGLRVEYLDTIYKNRFSTQRFVGTMLSPVKESPFFLT